MDGLVLTPATTTAFHAPTGRLARAVAVGLGVLLLTAAGLKLYGQNVTAVPQVGWFSMPRVQVAAAVWELVLGLWLLSGSYRAGAWLAAAVTFAGFAAVSGYFGWTGVTNCGCFGAVKASPWAAFGIDLLAFALLAVVRPPLDGGALRPPPEFATVGIGGAALLAILTVGGTFAYGSPQAAIARLRGESQAVTPGYVDFGTCSAGQQVKAAVTIQNFSDRPLCLYGGTWDCSCVATHDLPLTIPPGEARSVMVQLNVPATKPGAFTRPAELWSDPAGHRSIRFQVGCTVAP